MPYQTLSVKSAYVARNAILQLRCPRRIWRRRRWSADRHSSLQGLLPSRTDRSAPSMHASMERRRERGLDVFAFFTKCRTPAQRFIFIFRPLIWNLFSELEIIVYECSCNNKTNICLVFYCMCKHNLGPFLTKAFWGRELYSNSPGIENTNAIRHCRFSTAFWRFC